MAPSSANLIRCPRCTNILGEQRGAFAVIRHRGRTVVGLAGLISCEKAGCGGVWLDPLCRLSQRRLRALLAAG